jgi:hypothetical protein
MQPSQITHPDSVTSTFLDRYRETLDSYRNCRSQKPHSPSQRGGSFDRTVSSEPLRFSADAVIYRHGISWSQVGFAVSTMVRASARLVAIGMLLNKMPCPVAVNSPIFVLQIEVTSTHLLLPCGSGENRG